MRILNILTLSLLLMGLASPANGALTYVFEFQAPTFVLNPNQTVTGSLILREVDLPGVNPSGSLAAGSGLFGYAFSVNRLTGDATLSNLVVASGYAFQANPQPNPLISDDFIRVNLASANPFGNSPGVGDTSGVFTLATFDVTGGTTTSQFEIGNAGFPNPFSIGQNLSSLRSVNVSDITYESFSVTAVPEPSSMAVLGLVGCGALVRLRKRLGRKTAAV